MVQSGKTSDEGEVILGQIHIHSGMQKLLIISSAIIVVNLNKGISVNSSEIVYVLPAVCFSQ